MIFYTDPAKWGRMNTLVIMGFSSEIDVWGEPGSTHHFVHSILSFETLM